jgi:hypothetical protein
MQMSDEATAEELGLARAQGSALQRALEHMTRKVAHDGREIAAGEYRVAYAVEEAEGMYELRDGDLEWIEPEEANVHVEVAVRDAGDGRFVPGLKITATLLESSGRELGTHEQPFLWHPWLYHYGHNWTVPGDGTYTLRIHIDPPRFCRHDKANGRRYLQPVDVEFTDVKIKTGRK